MGLIDIDGAFPNFTKCSTWKDIKESHSSDTLVELQLHDVYGMLILLSIGLMGSVFGLVVEKVRDRKEISSRKLLWQEPIGHRISNKYT